MDSKYGRLYTGDDVHALIAEAHRGEISLDEFEGTFPADEPLFLLRGQDVAVPDALATGVGGSDPSVIVMDYYGSSANQGAPDQHLEHIILAAAEMKKWQQEHPDRIGVPD